MSNAPKVILIFGGLGLLIGGILSLIFTSLYPVRNTEYVNVDKSSALFALITPDAIKIEMVCYGVLAICFGFIGILVGTSNSFGLKVTASILLSFFIVGALIETLTFGSTFFFFNTRNDYNVQKQLDTIEIAFGCCGWYTLRDYPPCQSSIGSQANYTCYMKTRNITHTSLINFIFGAFFLFIGIILIITTAIRLFEINELIPYNEIEYGDDDDYEDEDVKDVIN
ncbi:hypothetical protein EIN_403310 [Entamoeba invadens IP1]|uniref:Tetraspanin family protein n=1 Tax=Entamoeba invadens IP1 TaxID=370355 RepID=A0A0A1U6I4_ENTIV|nr:hypothetical protein EIN_403310 [Entamoeba invadens IP1]ELP90007.1 hypothetical protein EIN_403310 [Entamoeba invadens IP1]|eukprot:XP_004256778.1 hypothetical protein EIN_403310 [Entamoeba invadens IP1]